MRSGKGRGALEGWGGGGEAYGRDEVRKRGGRIER